MPFQPSAYQQAILNWFHNAVEHPGSLIVEAVAGSGKTTTIVKASEIIPTTHKAVFLAFNKSIATELSERLPQHIESKTLNALGWAVLRSQLGLNFNAIDANKNRILVREMVGGGRTLEQRLISQHERALCNLVAKAKSHALAPMKYAKSGMDVVDTGIWYSLAERYQIEYDCEFDELASWATQILQRGIDDTSIVDFDDQIYLPVVLDLGGWKYDWVIIDEAQDVSHVQRSLLKRFMRGDSRLVAVGDSRQAIYGFRGADSESLKTIAEGFGAVTLPLSITYRCPKAVVAIAKNYVPQIEAHEDATEGLVRAAECFSVEEFTPGDMVVCRNTAPLITLAYRCIGQGVGVTVKGRDIGAGLVALVRKLSKRTEDIETFSGRLEAWAHDQIARATSKEDESLANSISDKYQSLVAVMDHSSAADVPALLVSIERLFSDKASGTCLSTVHKAKGLEADRVFILEPSLMPSKWAKQEWQMEQENNLLYVAVTRALKELVYLPLDNVV